MRITFGIGVGEDADGKEISDSIRNHCIHNAIAKASEMFGGCFVAHGQGGWMDENRELIIERGITLSVETIFHAEHAEYLAREFAGYVAVLFNQASIVVSVSPSTVTYITQEEMRHEQDLQDQQATQASR